jgi:hypothetical protein
VALRLLLLSALAVAGCRKEDKPTVAKTGPRTEDLSWGPIQISLTADPPQVELSRDILLTARLTAPSEIEVTWPPLDDRVQGFSLSGVFEEEPSKADGKTTRIVHARLTPVVAKVYRLAPLAIQYTDKGASPPRTDWFPTRPIVFEALPAFQGDPGKDIAGSLKPIWIYPPFKTVAIYVVLGILAIGVVVLLWKLFHRVRENIQLARMSPRERALRELSKLLAKDLVGKNLVKEFYLELTMIVRRYIERLHGIHAPEQTTEEFLVAVAEDSRFSPEVVRKLRAFLEAADLVKFAAHRPSESAIGKSTDTARQYIEKDTAEAEEKKHAGDVGTDESTVNGNQGSGKE